MYSRSSMQGMIGDCTAEVNCIFRARSIWARSMACSPGARRSCTRRCRLSDWRARGLPLI